MNLRTWARPIKNYERWIENESLDAARTWAQRLNASDDAAVEGAVAEAAMWNFLHSRGLQIHLADMPGTGGPDFSCERGEYMTGGPGPVDLGGRLLSTARFR